MKATSVRSPAALRQFKELERDELEREKRKSISERAHQAHDKDDTAPRKEEVVSTPIVQVPVTPPRDDLDFKPRALAYSVVIPVIPVEEEPTPKKDPEWNPASPRSKTIETPTTPSVRPPHHPSSSL